MRPIHYLLRGVNFENCRSTLRVCNRAGCTAAATVIEVRLGGEDCGWCDVHEPHDVPTLVYDRAKQNAAPKVEANDPARKGELASQLLTFRRGAVEWTVAAVHTRFEAVQWFAWSAAPERSVIRQASSYREACSL